MSELVDGQALAVLLLIGALLVGGSLYDWYYGIGKDEDSENENKKN